MDRPPLLLRVRYWIAKRFKEAQRMTSLITFGVIMVVFSPLSGTDAREAWLRNAGGGLVVWAGARWYAQQSGQRRKDPATGQDLRRRNPTLRMSPKQSEQLRHHLEKRVRRDG